MPSSNTPSDRDRACIRRCVCKRHRREWERLFKSIRWQHQGRAELWFHCIRWLNRDGTRSVSYGEWVPQTSDLLRGLQLKYPWRKFLLLPNTKHLVQTD